MGWQTHRHDLTVLGEDVRNLVSVGVEGQVTEEQGVRWLGWDVAELSGTVTTVVVGGWSGVGHVTVDLSAVDLLALHLSNGLLGEGLVLEVNVTVTLGSVSASLVDDSGAKDTADVLELAL